ncbi:DUF2797 domain-containing protein [Thalassotalea marina]|uniref:DUF2797 domain-containing protein n=1 Tax=Thalassotalea marina TaxID=1673741 RepID=A0A919EGV1_9GAMM|nr:DUF2797 domain-containing protein [Thalassotalea marina]GHF78215.1 hypothetical protein GCM10017161_01570 [Thalassotalea marina]
MQIETGPLKKMVSELAQGQVSYGLPVGEQVIPMNELIGQHVTLNYHEHISCQHCGRKTKKSYSQGFCFPCMQKLAQSDMCIMKPETCHFHLGTCREPEWGEQHCFIPHIVYLANTSGLKVGITRKTQIPTRWIDQGATQALPIFEVDTRLQSGLVEIELAKLIADKTNWRAMLKGDNKELDLLDEKQRLMPLISDALADIKLKYGESAVKELDQPVVELTYPVEQYPSKVSSFNFDKSPIVAGVLMGIKGQYLIFDTGVINIRKFTSYHVDVKVS